MVRRLGRRELIVVLRSFRSRRDASRQLAPDREIPLGAAWGGNSVNCVPFRYAPALSTGDATILSYFDDQGDVVVARIAASGIVDRHVIANNAKPFDAHQAISIGVDPSGQLHIAYGAHNSTLFGARSHSGRFEDGFSPVVEIAEDQTYPMFVRRRDELLLLSRSGPHFNGDMFVRRQRAGRWEQDETPLLSGASSVWSSGPYVNTPLVAQDDSISLFVVWRLNAQATSGGQVMNVGIDLVRSRDGLRSLETRSGIVLNLPVTPLTSERVIAVPLGANLINQASAALHVYGSPAFATYWSEDRGPPQYRLGWFVGNRIKVRTISRFETPFILDGGGTLPLPHSRPELLFDDQDRAFVLYRSCEQGNRLMASILRPPGYNIATARKVTLVEEDLGFYEPTVDRSLWAAKRRLGVYVQHCLQGRGEDGKPRYASAAARYLEWSHKRLLS